MADILTQIFGSKHEKDIKKIKPVVKEINLIYKEMDSLTDEELKAKTDEFKAYIKEQASELEQEEQQLIDKLQNEAPDAAETSRINGRLKKIEEELHDVIEGALEDILPEAFAAVKQACKRLKKAEYTYEYAGQQYKWDMIPFDVQLVGAIVLHQGRIAEMKTGEGKTLVAIMPLYLNALAERGAHLVTVNDYLARRDCEWMSPVYEFLGLKASAIQAKMTPDQRRNVYYSDITYGTNNEFGFDYLRDNMAVEEDHLVQRGHWYVIVDEVDSVLIDEARTPLIISGPVGQTVDQSFMELKPRVERLVEAQTKLVNKLVHETQELLKSDKQEDHEKAGVNLLTCYRGLPKHTRLAKLLQEPEYHKLMKDTELYHLRDQGRKMHEIDEQLYYTVDEKNHNVDISEQGRELLCNSQEDLEMFVIPDITTELSALEVDDSKSAEEKQRKKDQLHLLYSERSDRIHTINQLLRAYSLYQKDVEYVIQNGKVQIVDEFTGRILEGRRYSEGLHQAIEAKENVKVERDTQTLATITLQNYFRLYKKIAGMTGTAETEAGEFDKIYSLDVVVIPTNVPVIREDRDDLIYRTKREKYSAMINDIKKYIDEGRAILVGTTNVEVSEVISKMLNRQKIQHNVLNAKHHQKEAEIVANAGKKGALTIATNMAGRGTDIKLDHEVRKNGGLVIIGSERHDARRIDRQLRGRSGRQGDPGTSQFFISLEDDLMRLFGGERIAGVMQTMKVPEGEPIQHKMITKSVERAQKKVEENNFSIRKRLLDYDDVMNNQREVIYDRRRHALRGDRLKGELFEYIEDLVSEWFEMYKQTDDIDGFLAEVRAILLSEPKISREEFERMKLEECIWRVTEAADKYYKRKEEMLGSEFMAKLERYAVLQTIDEKWRDHLRVMDDLKEGIHLRAYGQKNPIMEYKGEAYKLFVELIKEINREAVSMAFKYFPRVVDTSGQEQRVSVEEKDSDGIPVVKSVAPSGNLQYVKSSQTPAYATANAPQAQQAEESQGRPKQGFRREQPKIGRNQLVKVKYSNGATKKAKYKMVEKDVKNGVCKIVESY